MENKQSSISWVKIGIGIGIVLVIFFILSGWRPKSVNVAVGPVSVSLEPSTPISPSSGPPNIFEPPLAPPSNACPSANRQFWLQYPNIWYGPFTNGEGLMLSNGGGFFVWNPSMINAYGTYGVTIPYPDPYRQIQRNIWNPLLQSTFSICVDSSGQVFGSY